MQGAQGAGGRGAGFWVRVTVGGWGEREAWGCKSYKFMVFNCTKNSAQRLEALLCVACESPRPLAPGQWACGACTFMNMAPACEMCGAALLGKTPKRS